MPADRSCHWQDKCFPSRWTRSLVSPMTCLSNMSDTTYVPSRVVGSWCRKIAESPKHDVSVTVTHTQPLLRFASHSWFLAAPRVRCTTLSADNRNRGSRIAWESEEVSSLAPTARLESETNGSFYCFTQSQRGLPPGPTARFVALDCIDLLQPDCASAVNKSARRHESTIQHSGDSSAGICEREG